MNKGIDIRLELGIDAQRFIQQIQLQNGALEEQISKGLELALNDLAEGNNLIQSIRESAKTEISLLVNKAVMSWEVKHKISKLIEEKIGERINVYADQFADKIMQNLENKQQ